MPGADLRALLARLLRAPHGERLGRGGGHGAGAGQADGARGPRGAEPGLREGSADGRGCRRPCGWTPRCSWPCCGGCSLACTNTCSRWASGPCSTCPSGSCASSPAPCLSPRCCASGTPSSVRVSGGPQAGGESWVVSVLKEQPATAHPGPGSGCRGVLRVMAPCSSGEAAQPPGRTLPG